MYLGAHESTAGGLELAFGRCAEHAGECMQIFTRSQRQWSAKPVGVREAGRFRAESERWGIPASRVMSHGSYLVNLATPERGKSRRSRQALLRELRRCEALGIELLDLHPGAHMGAGEEEGLARVVDSLSQLIEETPESPVRFVLETTAGQGSCLGHRFEHLRTILDGVTRPERIAVCLDTAHSFAAGYDLASESGYRRVMREFDAVVGLERLVAFHLNDSAVPLGSRVDRHAEIGRGHIGPSLFRCLAKDRRHRSALGILELPTPVIPANLKRLRRLRGKVAMATGPRLSY